MSGYYKQMSHGSDDAARGLRERLARKEMGDAAYEKSISNAGDGAFRIFGVVFIVLFALVVFGVVWLGH